MLSTRVFNIHDIARANAFWKNHEVALDIGTVLLLVSLMCFLAV